jgi:hypothetical protein
VTSPTHRRPHPCRRLHPEPPRFSPAPSRTAGSTRWGPRARRGRRSGRTRRRLGLSAIQWPREVRRRWGMAGTQGAAHQDARYPSQLTMASPGSLSRRTSATSRWRRDAARSSTASRSPAGRCGRRSSPARWRISSARTTFWGSLVAEMNLVCRHGVEHSTIGRPRFPSMVCNATRLSPHFHGTFCIAEQVRAFRTGSL